MANIVVSIVLAVISMSMVTTGEIIHQGKYKLKGEPKTPSAEYEAVLKEEGYSESSIKKMFETILLELKVEKEGDKYTVRLTLNTCEKTAKNVLEYKSGKEYDLILCDGRKVKAKNEYCPDKKTITRTITLSEGELRQVVSEISAKEASLHHHVNEKELDEEFLAISETWGSKTMAMFGKLF